MIITKITLNNFRQFVGVQKIDLINGKDKTKNVVVVFGENGRGKTGIFRALIFCLYGIKKLSQDADINENDLFLINKSVLEENRNTVVECYVELEFEHDGNHYSIRRDLKGIFDGEKTYEEEGPKKGIITSSDGNSKVIPSEKLDSVIRSILDQRVKDYFLFDGEKIERLTRASIEQKREISAGIRNLLNIDSLQDSIKVLKKVDAEISKDLQKSSNEKLLQQLNLLRENEKNFSDLEEIEEGKIRELESASSELIEINRNLEKISEIRSFLEERKQLTAEKSRIETVNDDILIQLKNSMPKAANLILNTLFRKTFETIEQKKKKGEIPSIIRKELIQQIIENKICICGNEVCEGSESFKAISEWLRKATDKEDEDELLDVWRHLGSTINNFDDDLDNIKRFLTNYGNNKSILKDIHTRLEEIGKKIGEKDREDAFKLEDIRRGIEKDKVRLEFEIEQIVQQKEDNKAENARLQIQLTEEKAKSDLNDEISQRSILVRDALKALTDVYDEFTEEIKVSLGNSATELFAKLIDHEGRRVLYKIIVNSDYSLEILDKFGGKFLANISAGQRQIMSISFIAALAKAASNGNQINIPLFMDTPFGRLSYDHRKNLINEIPNLASQWILLATDTEFRREEAKILQGSGRWGKFYILQPDEDGNTIILEKDLNSAISILQERSEENLA